MEFTLWLIAAVSGLVGCWAGRYSVVILAPLAGAALVLSILVSMALGESMGSIAAGAAVAVACLEAGYIAAFVIPALMAPAAESSGQAQSEPALLAELAYVPLPEVRMEDAAYGRRRLRRHVAET